MGEGTGKRYNQQSTESLDSRTRFPVFLCNDWLNVFAKEMPENRNAESIQINTKQENNQLEDAFISLFVWESLLSPLPGEK